MAPIICVCLWMCSAGRRNRVLSSNGMARARFAGEKQTFRNLRVRPEAVGRSRIIGFLGRTHTHLTMRAHPNYSSGYEMLRPVALIALAIGWIRRAPRLFRVLAQRQALRACKLHQLFRQRRRQSANSSLWWRSCQDRGVVDHHARRTSRSSSGRLGTVATTRTQPSMPLSRAAFRAQSTYWGGAKNKRTGLVTGLGMRDCGSRSAQAKWFLLYANAGDYLAFSALEQFRLPEYKGTGWPIACTMGAIANLLAYIL